MRILVLAHDAVWPPTGGGRIRMHNVVRRLVERGHEITVWGTGSDVLAWPEAPPANLVLRNLPLRRWQQSPVTTVSALASRYDIAGWMMRTPQTLAEIAAFNATAYDVCVNHHAQTGALAMAVQDRGIPLVFDTHNIESRLMLQMARYGRSTRRRIQLLLDGLKLQRLERALTRGATMILTVSAEDAARIEALDGHGQVAVVPNGVDVVGIARTDHDAVRSHELLMIGTLSYTPNIDGCRWVVREILPALRMRVPQAHVTFVGRDPTPEVLAMHHPEAGVTVVADAPDIRPYLERADTYIVPLRSGGGTRLKAIEAFAAGIPVVGTSIGLEGLGQSGEDEMTLVADTTAGLVDVVVRSFHDTALRRRLTAAARRHAETHFDWERIVDDYEAVLMRVCRSSASVAHV